MNLQLYYKIFMEILKIKIIILMRIKTKINKSK